jgi:hypothetical protein
MGVAVHARLVIGGAIREGLPLCILLSQQLYLRAMSPASIVGALKSPLCCFRNAKFVIYQACVFCLMMLGEFAFVFALEH